MATIFGFATFVSMIVIFHNDLSASYFTYKDAYWTVFYEKPYARIPGYLVGVASGCTYYSFKFEKSVVNQIDGESPEHSDEDDYDEDPADEGIRLEQESNLLKLIFYFLKTSSVAAIAALIGGWLTKMFLIYLLTVINGKPNDSGILLNLFFLLIQRPMFCCAIAFAVMPLILRNSALVPISDLLASSFWYPFSRLSFGAYLCHGIFMLFRGFNTERGVWACEFDAFLFFLAYLAMSFIFALVLMLTVEAPFAMLYKVFVLK
jgi:hypothetical protein